MSLEEKMRASAARYVRHGEQVHAVIGAQTRNPYLVVLIGFWYLFFNRYRMIVVTSDRIAVLDTGKVSFKRPSTVLSTPQGHPFGPRSLPGSGTRPTSATRLLVCASSLFNEIAKADLAVLACRPARSRPPAGTAAPRAPPGAPTCHQCVGRPDRDRREPRGRAA